MWCHMNVIFMMRGWENTRRIQVLTNYLCLTWLLEDIKHALVSMLVFRRGLGSILWMSDQCILELIGLGNISNEIQINSHLFLLPYICIVELDRPNHYLNQCWLIINWTLRNKVGNGNSNQNTKTFVHENAFESVVCEMASILSRRWVK